MCNFYDTTHPTIVEADNMDIDDAIARVQGAECIRKDALLEWAEGKKKHYMDRQEYDCGWNDLLDELIDKINSL